MVLIQGIYTHVWSCFKVNTQQIIAEVKTHFKKLKYEKGMEV